METDVQILKLSDLEKGSLLYCLAKANLDNKGYYECTLKDVKTKIIY